jgi:hypothetical protein
MKSENKKDSTKKTIRKYSVYVIRLKEGVLEKKKFREANPDYKEEKPCYYLGSTGKTPEVRAEEHRTSARNKRGRLYNPIAMNYFDGLRPSKYKRHNPISSQKKAVKKEMDLAEKLRQAGYGVWCH